MKQEPTGPAEHAAAIRDAIRRRYGFESEQAVPGKKGGSGIIDAANYAQVTAHWGLSSELPVIGRIVVIVQRALRIGLRWYVNPIVDQQNRFNDAAVRALYELQTDNDKLRAEIADLKQRSST